MSGLNVFETIARVTDRMEPFHSRFLVDALRASLSGERSLFEGFWNLAAPPDWPVPHGATVEAEPSVGEGKRIDLIITDSDQGMVLGIEVKTKSASAKPGQLEDYERGLVSVLKKRDRKIAISFLTPFNRKRAGDMADSLPTVRLFEQFARTSGRAAQHVSWLDVADLPWDGRDIWQQHQAYVRDIISSKDKLKPNVARNRTFCEFFGEGAAGLFWEALNELDICPEDTGVRIDLKTYTADPESLTRVFHILVEQGEGISRGKRRDQFPDKLRERFLDSRWYAFHEAIFDLSRQYSNVWIDGKKDYGVRVTHKRHSGGVSLVTTDGPHILKIGKPR